MAQSAHAKRCHDRVPSTPGRSSCSPAKKQSKKLLEDPQIDQKQNVQIVNPEIASALRSILDEKLEELATRLSAKIDDKIAELEKKFDGICREIKEIKEDFNDSLNHVENMLKQDIDATWEYAVRNEQYSRKNNLRILGVDEEEGEDLESKFITLIKENLDEEVKPEDVEVIHRIGVKNVNRNENQRSAPAKPRPVIVRFLSNKTKSRLLVKRRQLKGKKLVILEDMAPDLAKRLKRLKDKSSVKTAWFSNGKIKFKYKDDTRVMELQGWMALNDIE